MGRPILLVILIMAGCGSSDNSADSGTSDSGDAASYEVLVTLDGVPVEDALVLQGGGTMRWTTDANGRATVTLDPAVGGARWIMASHPEARIWGANVDAESSTTPIEIALTRFDPSDNEAYHFQDPGTPEINHNTSYCSHCHVTINSDWFASPHRTSASNPVLQNVYAGTIDVDSQTDCESRGGSWWSGNRPGTSDTAMRCYLGSGTLPDLNPDCGITSPCDGNATQYGACADCHAPAIDGVLGGRDLHEATGIAFDSGVQCDLCHKVESIDLSEPPGVGGRLHIVRPSEIPPSPTAGEFLPLTFAPFPDVMNPRMGSVYRPHFQDAIICGGCHQYDQPVLVADGEIDSERWPAEALPIHSTYEEWLTGPFAPDRPCQSCHMPPDTDVWNSGDLQMWMIEEGPAGGWIRPSGAVRRHTWGGPRQPEFEMLERAAELEIETSVVEGVLTANVVVRNIGAGHAIPTGEPMRSIILYVEASCEGVPLSAIGGDVIPDFGGYYLRKERDDDWTTWPGASPNQVVRVARRSTDAYHDYVGFGPFGDGTFDAARKGMPREEFVGEARIIVIDEAGLVTFETTLPEGDVAYLVDAASTPQNGIAAQTLAGAPGFGFARVLVDAAGNRMVPHHRAVDVASDNRILPQTMYETTHLFASSCSNPTVAAVLVHRAFPWDLARERNWTLTDSVMTAE